MRQVKLVGVHEDGGHLLLGTEDGGSFQLVIDEALRAAVSRPASRSGAPSPGASLAPREIQARIRSGATAEELSEESGLPLANVMRYAGPVFAEREYVAQQARGVEVSAPQANDGYRSTFGDDPATLGEVVPVRLTGLGIDAESAEWDAWRRSDGTWEVVVSFAPSSSTHQSMIGEEPPARWIFHPARKSLQNTNRWAQVLSELEPLDTPLGGRRLTAVSDRPFDFEADAATPAGPATGVPQADRDREDFLDLLRSRRGQRLGTDEDADDALAEALTRGEIPAAHPRDEEFVDADEAERLGLAEDTDHDGLPRLHDGVSTHTSEFTVVPSLRALRFDARDEPEPDGDDAAPDESGQPRKNRQKRSSVPSWDEIVFGRKND
ncbi:septation protein SepH [Zafaria sp. J156]|uniref:septation protein SepH n=1 Tax=Zafaria sp. J156 TaxID=3116490 RepID=UPI002E76909F|nr:septation protein SepH [Zafaria sp. J156]MEE1620099.1 septation protein SepH [Zafaria sp. J156]